MFPNKMEDDLQGLVGNLLDLELGERFVQIANEAEAPVDPTQELYDLIMTEADHVSKRDAFEGADLQGINWVTLPVTRATYREHRKARYRSYQNLYTDRVVTPDQVDVGSTFYRFQYTKLRERPYIEHFQLRHLAQAVSKQDLFFAYKHQVQYWNAISKNCSTVWDIRKDEDHMAHGLRVTCLCANTDIIAIGSFNGELGIKNLDSEVSQYSRISTLDNNILNHMCLVDEKILVSNNDEHVRMIDMRTMQATVTHKVPFSVNCSAYHDRLISCVGDATQTLLLDSQSGEVVHTLDDHLDFSYATTFSPDGILLATGNQDKTTRIYDMRMLNKSLKVLGCEMAAVQGLEFSADGQFLMATESADYVHLYDVASDFKQEQVIDLFGEIGATSFTPDGKSLFIANADSVYGGIMEYHRV